MPRRAVAHTNSMKFRREVLREAEQHVNKIVSGLPGLDEKVELFIASMPRGYFLLSDRPMIYTYMMIKTMFEQTALKLEAGQTGEPMRETLQILGHEMRELGKFLGLHKIKTSTGHLVQKLKDTQDIEATLDDENNAVANNVVNFTDKAEKEGLGVEF